MKRTPQDDTFATEFGAALMKKYLEAKNADISDQVFANSIGVERAQLDKYLRGEATPSVRTVVLAYRKYKIAVSYEGVLVRKAINDGKLPRARLANTDQLSLPFTIRAEGPENIELKFKPLSTRQFELQVTVKNRGKR